MTAAEKNLALATAIAMRMDASDPANGVSPLLLEPVARTLRLAQLTLHRWAEEMCNGTIQREGEQGDGKPYRPYESFYPRKDGSRSINHHKVPTPDREAGALRRVEKVCKEAGLHYHHQADPRGCALWVAAFPLDQSNYDQGIACI